ncbi:MAG: cytidylate kinase-like family protein [Oscillospiraceae bacterium]|nr:cytidylate kinase-like family protein [Oscillospiraceae bacterium]
MKKRWVITIGREFCSGGAMTARKVAELLDIPYYDKIIIDKTVEQTQFDPEVVAHHDEKPVGYFDIGGYQYGYRWYSDDPSLLLPLGMRIANAQFDVITQLADKGPCVIVGRCADYVLQDRPDVVNVFIRADMEKRVAGCRERFDITEAEARKLIKKTDRIRSNYYHYYTQKEWGSAKNYDLVIDAGKLGIDAAAQMIAQQVLRLDEA